MELRPDEGRSIRPIWTAAFPAAGFATLAAAAALVLVEADQLVLARDWLFFAYFIPVGYIVSLAGLLAIGLPLTHFLKRAAFSPWSILLGAVVGGAMGRLVTGLIGLDEGLSIDAIFVSSGFLFGSLLGFSWALLVRNRLIDMQLDEVPCID